MLIERQYEGVKRNHAQVRSLRAGARCGLMPRPRAGSSRACARHVRALPEGRDLDRTARMLARETLQSWSDDYASSMGAARLLHVLARLLLIVISVAGLFFGEQAARGEILDQLAGLMGTDGAQAVQALLASVNHPEAGIFARCSASARCWSVQRRSAPELARPIWRAGATSPCSSGPLAPRSAHGPGFLLMVSLVRGWRLVRALRGFLVDFVLSRPSRSGSTS